MESKASTAAAQNTTAGSESKVRAIDPRET
jgi:hypothetical protein